MTYSQIQSKIEDYMGNDYPLKMGLCDVIADYQDDNNVDFEADDIETILNKFDEDDIIDESLRDVIKGIIRNDLYNN